MTKLFAQLTAFWFRWVAADHFLIGTVAIVLAHLLHVSLGWTAIVLLVGGAGHEWFDGDLRPGLADPGHLSHPWEGVKDVVWFLVPLALGVWI